MGQERREHHRVARPIEGSWRGASGGSPCRIADVSMGGCFVQTLTGPTRGEMTVVTIQHGPDPALSLGGEVVYVERGMGFAVRFNALSPDEQKQLQRLVDQLRGPEAS